ncbi:LPS export ABC transporter permease LptG [Lysobacteraceae bacterium NML93-0792]|nr:LPS export ABC transporter permease LptG [Xanthomonadaceae bacterium NML93-0792]PBS14918.1 LPS export ABC transporter permease LptG [Xanthomonadaceae bacterium NML93-0793]PBS18722.1 LPS export ABC transporter permease LptG [Xanthomonadaceae bacterium NML93-0831]
MKIRPLLRIHDLYVARVITVMVLATWVVLTGLDTVMSGLLPEMDDIGQGQYGFMQALTYVIYTIPRRAYTMFPTAAVIGALMGLGQLAATSELIAMRAVGLSRTRISISVALPLLVLTALMVVNGEWVGPASQRAGDSMRGAALSNNMILGRYSGLWAREGDTFLNAQNGTEIREGGSNRIQLQDVRLFEFAADGRLESVAHAKTAEHGADGWRLLEVQRTWFEPRAVTRTEALEEQWASQLDASTLAASASNIWRPRYMPSSELRAGIEYRKRNELDASEFEEHYWGRWFYPLNVLALCLAAIPFAFGSLRSGNAGKRLFIGVVFALGFWLAQTQVVKLAAVYRLDYRLAYLIPPAVMLIVSWSLFRRRSG